jgi:hypothetical protein
MGEEWQRAHSGARPINWVNVSLTVLERWCRRDAEVNPDWHVDVTTMDLGEYLADVPRQKLWWLVNTPTSEQPEDGVYYDIKW